jgi:hypothetical protein
VGMIDLTNPRELVGPFTWPDLLACRETMISLAHSAVLLWKTFFFTLQKWKKKGLIKYMPL